MALAAERNEIAVDAFVAEAVVAHVVQGDVVVRTARGARFPYFRK